MLVSGQVIAAEPLLPGRLQADTATAFVSLVADFVTRLAAVATVGGFVRFIAFGGGLPRWTGRIAQLWFVGALAMAVANTAFVNGVPMGLVARLDVLPGFLGATPSGLAWLANAVVALIAAVLAYRTPARAGSLLVVAAGAIAWIFVGVTGNVSVGADHDWATDANAVASGAMFLILVGTFAAVGVAGTDARRRWRRAMPIAALVAAGGTAMVVWQQLVGAPPWSQPVGQAYLGLLLCLVLVAVIPDTGWAQGPAILLVGFLVSTDHLPPPRFLVPQSTQINYLGYEMNVPATVARLAGLGRPNVLWVALCLTALGLYAWGIVRVLRAGGTWPPGRAIAWTLGWGLMLYLAVSGLWEYSTAVFSWHMLVHMTVNMLIPILCVLGGPGTLIAQASRPAQPDTLPGPREWLADLGGSRLLRWVLSPGVLWLVYIGSLFAVYFTPVFAWLMRYHWAHQLMLLHFMAAGYLFFGLVIGVDKNLWPMPHIVRFALIMSVMPFHALFAVGLMSAQSVLGTPFYQNLGVSWVGDLLADQNTAGQITWFTGEIPMFVAVIAFALQWWRADHSEAEAADVAIDEGADDPMAAYNAMLADVARRDHALEVEARMNERHLE
mgnify:CR=1 FL=1